MKYSDGKLSSSDELEAPPELKNFSLIAGN